MKSTEFISEASTFPLRTLERVYHVGTMDVTKKRPYSFEGAGLSITTHPESWRAIGRGAVSGDTWLLSKPNNQFLDAHRLGARQRQEIMRWAVEQQLVRPIPVYRVTYYDDELESYVSSDHENMDSVNREYDIDTGDYRVRTLKSWMPTQKLKALVQHPHMSPTGIVDYVLPVWAEQQGLDGVWWQDRHNIFRMSAPRGVIVPSKVSSWTATKLKQEPKQNSNDTAD